MSAGSSGLTPIAVGVVHFGFALLAVRGVVVAGRGPGCPSCCSMRRSEPAGRRSVRRMQLFLGGNVPYLVPLVSGSKQPTIVAPCWYGLLSGPAGEALDPRACGVDVVDVGSSGGQTGSSPRVRGGHRGPRCRCNSFRFIPARAGWPEEALRARGRFIPACAGWPGGVLLSADASVVHPRACGVIVNHVSPGPVGVSTVGCGVALGFGARIVRRNASGALLVARRASSCLSHGNCLFRPVFSGPGASARGFQPAAPAVPSAIVWNMRL